MEIVNPKKEPAKMARRTRDGFEGKTLANVLGSARFAATSTETSARSRISILPMNQYPQDNFAKYASRGVL